MRNKLVKRALPIVITAVSLGAPLSASAQTLAITNARVIVGTGPVYDSGTIIVRDGRIAAVTGGTTPDSGRRAGHRRRRHERHAGLYRRT